MQTAFNQLLAREKYLSILLA